MKFELMTFIDKNGYSFLEYEDLNDYMESSSDKDLKNLLGYFDKYTNLTIEECNVNSNYLICYISSENDHHLIIRANNKFELITEYNKLIDRGQEEGYINIYNLDNLIYI